MKRMTYVMFSTLFALAVLPATVRAEKAPLTETADAVFDGGLENYPGRTYEMPTGEGVPDGNNLFIHGQKAVATTEQAFATIPTGELAADADCEIDLVDGRFGSRNSEAIQLFTGGPSCQAVVKVVLDPAKTEYTRARFELQYGDAIEGFTLNIGDSVSNNGYGGDGADQTRDSEVQIVGADLSVYGDDTAPTGDSKVLGRSPGLAVPGAVVVLEVSNNTVSWHNDKGVDGAVKSEHVFSLAGQKDTEGQPNYDIYAGFNQVVAGGRVGKGLKRVKIKLFH
ncbi:MAG: hypothetical protein CVV41_15640 [Candidatus Riflebacteria bacterium HGW-Riflebacteria-1]|jgi:hypothetical protein|nr:MAG: hypothetical protein CVV41_15640 [Candidatus Riflebacteria bacterium HGW-Riflebacteria-1]